jgi:exonuclease III
VPIDWQWSCIFDDYVDEIKDKHVLLDHICVSSEVKKLVTACGIAHDVFDDELDGAAHDAPRGERLSDHRPVYVDFK